MAEVVALMAVRSARLLRAPVRPLPTEDVHKLPGAGARSRRYRDGAINCRQSLAETGRDAPSLLVGDGYRPR